MSENIVPFKEQTVKKFFQQSCSNPDIKVPSVTLQMSAEMIRVFIVEAACRSLEQIAEPDYPVSLILLT